MRKSITLLSIDPSINSLGFAILINKKLIVASLLKSDKKEKDWIKKAYGMYGSIRCLVREHSVDCLVIEIPEYQSTAGFAARESGAVMKLMFLCGLICSLDIEKVTYTPSKWKGNLPKEVMKNRMMSDYPNLLDWETVDHNVVDAVAIGLKHLTGKV